MSVTLTKQSIIITIPTQAPEEDLKSYQHAVITVVKNQLKSNADLSEGKNKNGNFFLLDLWEQMQPEQPNSQL